MQHYTSVKMSAWWTSFGTSLRTVPSRFQALLLRSYRCSGSSLFTKLNRKHKNTHTHKNKNTATKRKRMRTYIYTAVSLELRCRHTD